jgi:hypothetical protein
LNPHGEAHRDVAGPARTSRRFDLTSAALAFALWGGWAYWVNRQMAGAEPRASPLISGLTQGTGSFVITLFLVRAVAWIYHRLPAHPLRLVLPGVLTVTATGTCLAIAHTLVGTADVARTIAPALSVAFAFCVFTAFKIRRAQGAGAGTKKRPDRE